MRLPTLNSTRLALASTRKMYPYDYYQFPSKHWIDFMALILIQNNLKLIFFLRTLSIQYKLQSLWIKIKICQIVQCQPQQFKSMTTLQPTRLKVQDKSNYTILQSQKRKRTVESRIHFRYTGEKLNSNTERNPLLEITRELSLENQVSSHSNCNYSRFQKTTSTCGHQRLSI